jgi:hypothetical protein
VPLPERLFSSTAGTICGGLVRQATRAPRNVCGRRAALFDVRQDQARFWLHTAAAFHHCLCVEGAIWHYSSPDEVLHNITRNCSVSRRQLAAAVWNIASEAYLFEQHRSALGDVAKPLVGLLNRRACPAVAGFSESDFDNDTQRAIAQISNLRDNYCPGTSTWSIPEPEPN